MPEQRVLIQNKLGLHARASAKFASTASRFACEVSLLKGDVVVNGKSIMGIMMLAAAKGTELTIRTEGTDADQAMHELESLVAGHFGEDQ